MSCIWLIWLVVSTPLKNISENGNLPQIGMKIKNIWNHHLVMYTNFPSSHSLFFAVFASHGLWRWLSGAGHTCVGLAGFRGWICFADATCCLVGCLRESKASKNGTSKSWQFLETNCQGAKRRLFVSPTLPTTQANGHHNPGDHNYILRGTTQHLPPYKEPSHIPTKSSSQPAKKRRYCWWIKILHQLI